MTDLTIILMGALFFLNGVSIGLLALHIKTGPRGKQGEMGPPGAMGMMGEPGYCDCECPFKETKHEV